MKRIILFFSLLVAAAFSAEAVDLAALAKPPSNLFPNPESVTKAIDKLAVAKEVEKALANVPAGQKGQVLNQIASKVGGNYSAEIIGNFNALQASASGSIGGNQLAQQFSFLSSSMPNTGAISAQINNIGGMGNISGAVSGVTSIPTQAMGSLTNSISSLSGSLNVAGISGGQITQIAGLMQTGSVSGAMQFGSQIAGSQISGFINMNFGNQLGQAQQLYGQAAGAYQQYLGYMNQYQSYLNSIQNLPSSITGQLTGMATNQLNQALGPMVGQAQQYLNQAMGAYNQFSNLTNQLSGVVNGMTSQITQMVNNTVGSLTKLTDVSGVLNGLTGMIPKGVNVSLSGINMNVGGMGSNLNVSVSGMNFGSMQGGGNMFGGGSSSGQGGSQMNSLNLAKGGVAGALGLGFNGQNIVSAAPKYEDKITGLTPERTADAFCEGGSGNCKNLIPLCEDKVEKSATGPVTVTKYSVGDCMTRASMLAMGTQFDFTSKVKKQSVDKNYTTSYKVEDSKVVGGNWKNFYFKSMSVASQRAINMKCTDGVLNKNGTTTSSNGVGGKC